MTVTVEVKVVRLPDESGDYKAVVKQIHYIHYPTNKLSNLLASNLLTNYASKRLRSAPCLCAETATTPRLPEYSVRAPAPEATPTEHGHGRSKALAGGA